MLGNTKNGKAADEGDFHVMGAPHEPRLANTNKSCWQAFGHPQQSGGEVGRDELAGDIPWLE